MKRFLITVSLLFVLTAISKTTFSQEEAYFTCKHYVTKKYNSQQKEYVTAGETDANYAIKITQEKIMFYCMDCSKPGETGLIVKLTDDEPETKQSIVNANNVYKIYSGVMQDGSNENIKVILLYENGRISEITFGNSRSKIICSKLSQIK